MNVKYRRAIGVFGTLSFIVIYVIFASILGNFFLSKPLWIKMIYFIVAGIVWVFPLRPLYIWMRPKPEEMPQGEKPPTASNVHKRRR